MKEKFREIAGGFFRFRSHPWTVVGAVLIVTGGLLPERVAAEGMGFKIPYGHFVGTIGFLLLIPIVRESIYFLISARNKLKGEDKIDGPDKNP